MRLAVFVKPEHEARISHVNTASVRTGLGNTLGTARWSKCVFISFSSLAWVFSCLASGHKGAVGVSFLFNGTAFGFVNCHLSSGSEKILRCVCKNTHFQRQNSCRVINANVPHCLGGIRTFWTSSGCSAWERKTAPLTSACASPTSFGVGISTTDWI